MTAAVALGWQCLDPLWFLAGLVVAAVFVRRRSRRLGAALALAGWFAGPAGQRLPPRTWRAVVAAAPPWLELVGALLFVLALARPVHVRAEPPDRLGRDVMLCFDRSSSMAATDLDPARSRLAVGKQLAAEFVARRSDDRIGFVSFARYADLGCPPTVDHAALLDLLQPVELVARDGPEDATAIGAAVAMAAHVLQRSTAAGRVLVVLTDGEENVATAGADDEIAPLVAGQWCRRVGIRVHTIVLGRGRQQADGRLVALDTTAVRQLAEGTGGRFFTAADATALRAIYAEIDAVEAAVFAEPGVAITEWFVLPLLGGLVLFGLAHALACSPLGGVP